MRAIEFKAKIRDGVIEIPQKYRKLANQLARIIILTDEDEPLNTVQDKESIQLILKELSTRKVFADIEDPVAWQRSIRDEWD